MSQPKDYGRINHSLRTRKWQAFAYEGKRDVKLGDFETRDEAIAALQKHIHELKHPQGEE